MSNAAALAGVAQNAHFRTSERLAAAKQALDFYVDQEDKLRELLADVEANPSTNWQNLSEADRDHTEMVDRLRTILDGE